MPRRGGNSLIGGRNLAPLDEESVKRVINTFLGLDNLIDVQYDSTSRTKFVVQDDDGERVGRIVFGPDIYPGKGVVDPNSALSMQAAVAHELTHFHRWRDLTELPFGELDDLDEALTSLEGALRYERRLSEHEMKQLIRDAIQRIQSFARRHMGEDGAEAEDADQ